MHIKRFDEFISESFNTKYKWSASLDAKLKEEGFLKKRTSEPGHTMVYKDGSTDIDGYIIDGNVSPVKGVIITYAVTDDFNEFLKQNAELI